MIITVSYYPRKENFKPDYDKPIVKYFEGKNASECMLKIRLFKNYHDLNKFTKSEIVYVED